MNLTEEVIEEAIQFANDRPSLNSDEIYLWATDAEDLIRTLCERIDQLETDLQEVQVQRQASNRRIEELQQELWNDSSANGRKTNEPD